MEKKFGDLLQTLRKEKGWTQQQLADLLNVTNKTVSKWERNEAYPETSTLLEISKLFGVSVDDLLNGRKNQSQETNSQPLTEHLIQEWQIVQAQLISKCFLAVGLMLFYGVYFFTHHFVLSFFVFVPFIILSFLIILLKNKKLEVFTGKNQVKKEILEWAGFLIAIVIFIVPCYNWKVKVTPEDILWPSYNGFQPDFTLNESGELFISAYMTPENYLGVFPYLSFLSVLLYSIILSIVNRKMMNSLKIAGLSILLVALIFAGTEIYKEYSRTQKNFEPSIYEKYKQTYLNIAESSIGIPEDMTDIDADKFDNSMTGMYERYKDIVAFDDETYTVYYEFNDEKKEALSSVLSIFYFIIAGASTILMLLVKKRNNK